jgi:hypothetical protein
MAAAFVTGAIAKIWSVCEACTDVQVKSCITSFTAPLSIIPEGFPMNVGLVQAEAAYNWLVDVEECCKIPFALVIVLE